MQGRAGQVRVNEASVVHAVPRCGRTAAAYTPAMALPVLPLLAIGLLGYAGYRVAKTAAAERNRRRRDWPAVQAPEPVAAGKEESAQDGGATGDDPVVEGSADPWAETDAGHPDESASDSLDHHPQPEDEARPRPGG
jgi:hypothetical protein